MPEKILSRNELRTVLAKRRAEGHRIVFTNGCFDLMHVGHVRYLDKARRLGDVLVVGLNTDASVRSLGKSPARPIVPDVQRAEVVGALAAVDYIVLFDEPDPRRLIEEVEPDVLVKGGDWALGDIIGRDVVERRGGVVTTIPLVPGISTTALIQRIKQS